MPFFQCIKFKNVKFNWLKSIVKLDFQHELKKKKVIQSVWKKK